MCTDTRMDVPSVFRNDPRIGYFEISSQLLLTTPREVLEQVFLQCIPVQVDYQWHRDTMRYLAWSTLFQPVRDGEEIPTYEIVLSKFRKPAAGDPRGRFEATLYRTSIAGGPSAPIAVRSSRSVVWRKLNE